MALVGEFIYLAKTSVDDGSLQALNSLSIDTNESIIFLGKTDTGTVRNIHTYRYSDAGSISSLVKNIMQASDGIISGLIVDQVRKFAFAYAPKSYTYDASGNVTLVNRASRTGAISDIDTALGVVSQEYSGDSGFDSLKYNTSTATISFVDFQVISGYTSDTVRIDPSYQFFVGLGSFLSDSAIMISSYDSSGNLSLVKQTSLGFPVNGSLEIDYNNKIIFIDDNSNILAYSYDAGGNISQIASTPRAYSFTGKTKIDIEKNLLFAVNNDIVSYQYSLDGSVSFVDQVSTIGVTYQDSVLDTDNTTMFVYDSTNKELYAYRYAPQAPQNLTALKTDKLNEVFVSWDTIPSVDGYEVHRDINPNFNSTQLVRVYSDSANSFVDEVPYLDITYYYRVRGYQN